ncbi:MAG: DUF167 domain-containing protein [Candidatus Saccharicenans sp.]|nr:MAG: hypothetical protein C0168_00280 [Candidatus Aminicenantes bacterium]HEK85484.1 DUF167 domain-containing protein [Candidatus Aminicenantes bacterium]
MSGIGERPNRKKTIFTVKVQPRASRQELIRVSETEFRARLTSPPEKGRANDELLKLLADYLGLPPSALRIIRGQSSRVKLIESL